MNTEKSTREILAALQAISDERTKALIKFESLVNNEQENHRLLENALLKGTPPPSFSDQESAIVLPFKNEPLLEVLGNQNWAQSTLLAREALIERGIDPDKIPVGLPYHQLDMLDVTVAVGIGMAAALVPSIDFQGDSPRNLAGIFRVEQDKSLRDFIEGTLKVDSSSSIMDSLGGGLHRFAQDADGKLSHDLFSDFLASLSPNNSAVPFKTKIAHLLIDAFGATGIPIPGTEAILKTLDFFEAGSPSPRELSRYFAYRHTDAVGTGVTSFLLALYEFIRKVPKDSFRPHKLGIIAHGTCAGSICALAPIFPHLAARRSLVNYTSAAMFLKNCYQLHSMARSLRKKSEALSKETDEILTRLFESNEQVLKAG